MFKTCKASEIQAGQRIADRDGYVWEVTSVRPGSKSPRFGVWRIDLRPLMVGMTDRGPQTVEARPNDVFTLAEFAN